MTLKGVLKAIDISVRSDKGRTSEGTYEIKAACIIPQFNNGLKD